MKRHQDHVAATDTAPVASTVGIAVVLAVLAGVLGACGGGGSESSPRYTLAPTTSVDDGFGGRSRAIPVADLDPCSLITEAQRRTLGYPEAPRGDTDISTGGPARACWLSDGERTPTLPSAKVAVSAASGYQVWLNNMLPVVATKTSVNASDGESFPAANASYAGDPACVVSLDVADGQQLFASWRQPLAQVPSPVPAGDLSGLSAESCAKARTLVEAALNTLVARTPWPQG